MTWLTNASVALCHDYGARRGAKEAMNTGEGIGRRGDEDLHHVLRCDVMGCM